MFLGREINIVKMTILPNAIYRFNAKVKVKSLASNSLQPPGLQPTRLLCTWDFVPSVHGVVHVQPTREYWSRLPFPSPGDLLNPGIQPRSPALQADSLPTELSEKLYLK